MAKILIANRGEIALRALQAAHDLGHQATLFCTPADRETEAYLRAPQVHLTAHSEAAQSYLNLSEIEAALRATGADALYPGYGFLSEKAELAELCERHRITFIGPSSQALQGLAHKGGARSFAQAVGLQTLELKPPPAPRDFPVLLKAAHGGGGRGHLRVDSPADLASGIQQLTQRAQGLFNSTELIYERFLADAHHVEMQIFHDQQGRTHFLGTRDCTFQRHFQKLIEEGPAHSDVWNRLSPHFAAIQDHLNRVRYLGPGTLEFLRAPSGELYFLEINCRIQVEHTVTEELIGVDLVREQIANALTPYYQFAPTHTQGHALQLRLYAEDPAQGFIPSIGKLETLRLPQRPFSRWDMSYRSGQTLSPFYDPLLGKLIVRDRDRTRCIQRACQVLEGFVVAGVQTNASYLLRALRDPTFLANGHTIQWAPRNAETTSPWSEALKQDVIKLARGQAGQVSDQPREGQWKNSHRDW